LELGKELPVFLALGQKALQSESLSPPLPPQSLAPHMLLLLRPSVATALADLLLPAQSKQASHLHGLPVPAFALQFCVMCG
jgi:hypothetical protein